MEYQFEWDPRKDQSNQRKHDVSFSLAATIFADSNHLSIFDEEHSDEEDRWITLGLTSSGILCIVVHTFAVLSDDLCKIRLISARQAVKDEAQQYRDQMP